MATSFLNRHGTFEYDAKPPSDMIPGTSKSFAYQKSKPMSREPLPNSGEKKSPDANKVADDDEADDGCGSVDYVKELLLDSVLMYSTPEDKGKLEILCDQIKKFDGERMVQTDQLLDMYYERVEDDMPVEDIISKHLKGTDSCKTETLEQMDTTIIPTSNSSSKSDAKPEKKKELKPELTCKVCLDNQVAVTFVPCGHLVTCVSCTAALFECPVCRAQIRGTIRTYL